MKIVSSLRAFAFGSLILSGLALAAPPARADDPARFMQTLGDQTIQILQNRSLAQAQRKDAFSKLFRDGFDVPTIARFVLGRYWRQATPQQQSEFVKTFGDYIVAIYSQQFSSYSGQVFKITGEQHSDQTTTSVTSEIEQPSGGPPIHLSWIVENENGAYKIVDVNVENVSLRTTKRDEFASVINQDGGNIQALIDQLRQKVAAS